VQGGTFTITNPGVFGALFGMPIINQPQVAILGVGNIEKAPVVVDDAIAIRPMAYLSLGYDHRVIDGAVATNSCLTSRRRSRIGIRRRSSRSVGRVAVTWVVRLPPKLGILSASQGGAG
jgi:hypothetical protein